MASQKGFRMTNRLVLSRVSLVIIGVISLSAFLLGESFGASASRSSGGSRHAPSISHGSVPHISTPSHSTPIHNNPRINRAPTVIHSPSKASTPVRNLDNRTVRTQFRDKSGKLWGTAISRGNRSEFRNASGKLLTRSATSSDGTTQVRDASGKLLLKINTK